LKKTRKQKLKKGCGHCHRDNKTLLSTSGFVGVTVWLITSSLFYLAERTNPELDWCVPEGCCLAHSPAAAGDNATACLELGHRFESIPSASYFTLLNLFGEFPLADKVLCFRPGFKMKHEIGENTKKYQKRDTRYEKKRENKINISDLV
jgi:hypothetical protein